MSSFRMVAPGLLLTAYLVTAGSWPQYRGPAVDGKSHEKMISVLPEIPQPRWKVPTPLAFSSFAVDGQSAFVIVRREVDGVPRDVLLALETERGTERWSVPLSAGKYDGSA